MDSISLASTTADIEAVRLLFVEYAQSLDFNLCFQNFEQELATLPGVYSPPQGALFLARVDEQVAGCIGLRHFSGATGEVKRLYVRPLFRGRGIARRLVSSVIQIASTSGYRALVLDNVAAMLPAIALYESVGFERVEAYYSNPLPDVLYFRKMLEVAGC